MTRAEVALAWINGLMGLSGLLLSALGLVTAVGVFFSSGPPLGGQGMPGLGQFFLLATGVLALSMVPVCGLMCFVAWRVRRNHPLAIRHLLQLAWISSGLATLSLVVFGLFWGRAIIPETQRYAIAGMVLLGWPLALYSVVHLLILLPRRQSVAAIAVMVLLPVATAAWARFPQTRLSNTGRIQAPRDEFVDLQLTGTGHLLCLSQDDAASRTLRIVDFQTAGTVVQKPFEACSAVLVCRAGDRFVARRRVSDGIYSGLLVCKIPEGELESTLPDVAQDAGVSKVELSSDGNRVAVISASYDGLWTSSDGHFRSNPQAEPVEGLVKVHSLPDGKLLHSFTGVSANQQVRHVTLDRTGELLAIGTADGNQPAEISLWSLKGPVAKRVWMTGTKGWYAPAFDLKSSRLLSLEHGSLVCFDLASGKVVARHAMPESIHLAEFSQDGSQLGLVLDRYDRKSGRTGAVAIYDTVTGQKKHSFEFGPEAFQDRGKIAMNMDTQQMILLNPQTRWIQRWDVSKGVELR